MSWLSITPHYDSIIFIEDRNAVDRKSLTFCPELEEEEFTSNKGKPFSSEKSKSTTNGIMKKEMSRSSSDEKVVHHTPLQDIKNKFTSNKGKPFSSEKCKSTTSGIMKKEMSRSSSDEKVVHHTPLQDIKNKVHFSHILKCV
ncbi:hypothetical protein NDU88_004647 [Pleurodeles waltl]|uniref:Uncharacterized protein n=1 Tax=Pleurodeles waltl TaxID=8319 RepID=A0AAV7VIU8_PLEWA|nr:hypothetical protein NDU88_004647 [Pleurodeles waltl]